MSAFCTQQLVELIGQWARELGFAQTGISGVDLTDAEPALLDWLEQGFYGDMHYMREHGLRRARPAELVPGTVSVITARMNYLPAATPPDWPQQALGRLAQPQQAYISLYARGRDYHKVLRQRLQKLATRIAAHTGPFGHRVFCDSAPVLEVALAQRSGLGWRGKHSLLLSREAGSMFFIGEIFVDLALPESQPVRAHCGKCDACLPACPTGAILRPGVVDARRCISYLTIEHPGSIAPQLRPLMGNRIYGCDDCQLVCPWNRFAPRSALDDFDVRHGLDSATLARLFAWSEDEFLQRTEGSPIRRIGHARWLRNIAIALGNALAALRACADQTAAARNAAPLCALLEEKRQHESEIVREHVLWALQQWENPHPAHRNDTACHPAST